MFCQKYILLTIAGGCEKSNVGEVIGFTAFTHLNCTMEITWIQDSTGVILASKDVVCTRSRDFKIGSYLFQQSFLQIKPIKC